MRRTFLVVLISAAAFSLLLFAIKDEKGPGLDLKPGESFIEGLRIVHKRNGEKDWIVTARRADISENGERAYLSDVGMTHEKQGLTLHADKGLYTLADRHLTVEGRIVAQGKDYSITSEKLDLTGADGKVKTEAKVNIRGKKFSLEGRGMDIDTRDRKMRIHNDVKAVFHQ